MITMTQGLTYDSSLVAPLMTSHAYSCPTYSTCFHFIIFTGMSQLAREHRMQDYLSLQTVENEGRVSEVD
jgi:hypothetical protein